MPQERNHTQSHDRSSQKRTQKRRRKRSFGATLSFAALYVLFVVGVSALLACAGWIAANDVLALNKDDHEVTITITADMIEAYK